jgi:hypothetical protein
MRGKISTERMGEIHAGLPYSFELRRLNPVLENPLLALGSAHGKFRACIRLSQGWHMLNEARLALLEAEACKAFYEECEPNADEAIYRCRFYLDDAALRLCSSCDHLLLSIKFYWRLNLKSDKSTRAQDLLDKVIAATKKSSLSQLSGGVTTALQGLTTDWRECKQYRNDWVHNERPGVGGLDWDFSFLPSNESDIPPDALKFLGSPRTVMTLGTGREITVLHRVIRSAYCQLYSVYERLAPLFS